MAEYINRDELLRHYEKYYCKPCREKGNDYKGIMCRACGTGDAIETAEDIPAADVRENVRGIWEYKFPNIRPVAHGTVTCSICKTTRVRLMGDVLNFCPFCGADMRGENDERT